MQKSHHFQRCPRTRHRPPRQNTPTIIHQSPNSISTATSRQPAKKMQKPHPQAIPRTRHRPPRITQTHTHTDTPRNTHSQPASADHRQPQPASAAQPTSNMAERGLHQPGVAVGSAHHAVCVCGLAVVAARPTHLEVTLTAIKAESEVSAMPHCMGMVGIDQVHAQRPRPTHAHQTEQPRARRLHPSMREQHWPSPQPPNTQPLPERRAVSVGPLPSQRAW